MTDVTLNFMIGEKGELKIPGVISDLEITTDVEKVEGQEQESKNGENRSSNEESGEEARSTEEVVEEVAEVISDVVSNWREHWHEALPITGKALPFVLHAHVKGLTKEEAELPWEEIAKGDRDIHYDLRLGSNRFDGYWGFTLKAAPDPNPGTYIPSEPKFFGPSHWLQIGVKNPHTLESVAMRDGAPTFSKFFAIDRGVWKLASATGNHVEMWLFGNSLNGRYFWRFHEDQGTQQKGWRFQRAFSDKSYADQFRLEEILAQEKERGGQYVIWPRDTQHLERGMKIHDVSQLAQATKYEVLKAAPAQQYTLGVAYPAMEIDAHQDFMTVEELERAAWRFLAKGARIGLMHKRGTDDAGKVVESYIYRFDPTEYNGQKINPGDWLLGVVWSDAAWKDIQEGRITGFSIQGLASRVLSGETRPLRDSMDNVKS